MRMTVATAVACLLGVGISTAHDAHAAIKQDTTIPAQGLGTALKQLAGQRDIQLVYRSEVVGERQTSGAVGELTFDEALTKLLKGTGLTYQYLDDRAVTIVHMNSSTPPSDSSTQALSDGVWGRFRLAQAEQGSTSPSSSSRVDIDRRATLEEIIVTAQKREERLQDVPIAISVVGGEQLDSYTGGTARDILRTVPAVTFAKGILGDGTTLSIRGVSPAGLLSVPFGSSTVGYYMDGVPFGFVNIPTVPDTNVYDLERIEVLRGPQGTLYGASSLNGVVRVLTHEADLNELQFKARTSASTTKDGAETYRVDSAINVPILEDKLAARATVSYADVGGWIDNLVSEDINSAENLDARLKVKAQPTDALSIGVSYWRSRHDVDAPDLSDSNDFYPGRLDPTGDIDFDTYGAELAYEFPGFTVSSTTSRIEYSNVTELDWSPFVTVFPGAGLDGYFITILDAEVFSEELLIRSSNDSDWRWSVGAIYRDAKSRFSQINPPFGSNPGFGIFSDARSTSESYAVFGELTKLFLDGALELTGGLRHFHDRVEDTDGLDSTFSVSASFEKVSPRAVLAWHANEGNTLYASYSQGFRSGFNQNRVTLSQVPNLPPTEPDTLDNYEIGVKGSLRDNRLAYEAAVYFVDWQDTQQSLCVLYGEPEPIFCSVAGLNAESASGPGAEIALTLRPVDRLTLTGSFGVSDITVDAPIVDGNHVLYEKGSRLNGSAKYTAAASASYTFPLGGSGLQSTLSLSGNYSSSLPQRAVDATNGAIIFTNSDSFRFMQCSVSVAAADRWSLQLFADNLTNERPVQADPGSSAGIQFYNRYAQPRAIGVQFEYNY